MIQVCYRYDGTFPGFLTCVFEAYANHEPPAAFLCQSDPTATLWPEREVETDRPHARRVYKALGEKISPEFRHLVERAFLTPQQGEAVDPAKIAAFFASPLGRELMASTSLRREFKFSILVPAADYYPQAGAEEQVLLQGVVDCCFETLEGITVVDFKTDRVDRRSVAARAEEYRPQLAAYSRALEEITGKPVIRRCLWFFALDQAVDV